MKLPDSGTLCERNYSFFWQGKDIDEVKEHGVGLAMKNSLLKLVELNNIKDKLYNQLSRKIQVISNGEHLVLLGDFNARVGADRDYWPECQGWYRIGNSCLLHRLCVTNTYFQAKAQHRVSWHHPCSEHWHQLDLIITRHNHLRNVLLTRSFQDANCNTDHSLVCCNLKLHPKMMHCTKPPGKQCISTTATQQPTKTDAFLKTLEDALIADPHEGNVQLRWDFLRDIIHSTALRAFGKRRKMIHDWFEANMKELSTPRGRRNIQLSFDMGNIHGMYEGIKKAITPTQSKIVPLKSRTKEVTKSKREQLKRWVEHYSKLYAKENNISDSALDTVEHLPITEELDTLPTAEQNH
uniref:Endonuclease/exonuclease/phosphatase domain-containing protein n=1 Tax=Octopus bimaculoides TaxID=37653 RepID=A0A0L8H7R9_OCTBM